MWLLKAISKLVSYFLVYFVVYTGLCYIITCVNEVDRRLTYAAIFAIIMYIIDDIPWRKVWDHLMS